MIHVRLGNVAPHDTLGDEAFAIFDTLTEDQLAANGYVRFGAYIVKPLPDLGEAVCDVAHPNDSVFELVTNIKKFWPQHSMQNPAWVESSNSLAAQMIAAEFPGCVVREIEE